MNLKQNVQDKAAHAGELLIRAAAVIGTLSPEEQAQLAAATEGKLTDCLAWAIEGAAIVSPQVKASLQSTPPAGFQPKIFA